MVMRRLVVFFLLVKCVQQGRGSKYVINQAWKFLNEKELGTRKFVVQRWYDRFRNRGWDGIYDLGRPGRPRLLAPELVQKIGDCLTKSYKRVRDKPSVKNRCVKELNKLLPQKV